MLATFDRLLSYDHRTAEALVVCLCFFRMTFYVFFIWSISLICGNGVNLTIIFVELYFSFFLTLLLLI